MDGSDCSLRSQVARFRVTGRSCNRGSSRMVQNQDRRCWRSRSLVNFTLQSPLLCYLLYRDTPAMSQIPIVCHPGPSHSHPIPHPIPISRQPCTVLVLPSRHTISIIISDLQNPCAHGCALCARTVHLRAAPGSGPIPRFSATLLPSRGARGRQE
jgi:hypothetical protein